MLARHKPAAPVARMAVSEIGGGAIDAHAKFRDPAEQPVIGNIAPHQKAGIVEPDGALRPAAAAEQLFNVGNGNGQLLEALVVVVVVVGGQCHEFPRTAR